MKYPSEQPKVHSIAPASVDTSNIEADFYLSARDIQAKAKIIDGEFYVPKAPKYVKMSVNLHTTT